MISVGCNSVCCSQEEFEIRIPIPGTGKVKKALNTLSSCGYKIPYWRPVAGKDRPRVAADRLGRLRPPEGLGLADTTVFWEALELPHETINKTREVPSKRHSRMRSTSLSVISSFVRS